MLTGIKYGYGRICVSRTAARKDGVEGEERIVRGREFQILPNQKLYAFFVSICQNTEFDISRPSSCLSQQLASNVHDNQFGYCKERLVSYSLTDQEITRHSKLRTTVYIISMQNTCTLHDTADDKMYDNEKPIHGKRTFHVDFPGFSGGFSE